MKSMVNILHISPTPLVGAPGKISRLLSQEENYHSTCLVVSDYPKPLDGKFLSDSILWNQERPEINKLAKRLIKQANIVHIHNLLPKTTVDVIVSHENNPRYIYHVHSPPREGPIYCGQEKELPFSFSAKLVVGQYQPRHFVDYIPVPNLVDLQPTRAPLRHGECPRVLYSPAHRRSGRWNCKISDALDDAINTLHRANLIEAVVPDDPLPPNELMALRRTTHISIDEITTGAFHRITLEALCAGNVVVNNADFFSIAMLRSATGADKDPPFVRCNEGNVFECLRDLVSDPLRILALQEKSEEYFLKYLMPDKLIHRYTDVYSTALDA